MPVSSTWSSPSSRNRRSPRWQNPTGSRNDGATPSSGARSGSVGSRRRTGAGRGGARTSSGTGRGRETGATGGVSASGRAGDGDTPAANATLIAQAEPSSWANLFPADLLGTMATYLDPESVGSFAVTAGPQISLTIKRAWLKKNLQHLFKHRDNPTFFRAFLDANDDWRDWYDEPGLLSSTGTYPDDRTCFDVIFNSMLALIRFGQVEVVRHLIEARGHDINELDKDTGECPLLCAVLSGHLPMVQYILSVPGLDINARVPSGRSMLHLAVTSQRVSSKCLALLLSHSDMDINITVGGGITPLMLATDNDSGDAEEKLLLLLVHKNINVNARDNDGFTPLHYAISDWLGGEDSERVVKHLIEAGADIHTQDDDGRTPLDFIEMRGNEQQAALVKKWSRTGRRKRRGVKRKATTA